MPEPVMLFLHIPKTAGTTLWSIFYRLFPGRAIRVQEGDVGENAATIRRMLADPTDPHRLIGGHFVYGVANGSLRPTRQFTMLRNPADRAISNYFRILRNSNNRHHQQFHEENIGLADGLRIMPHNNQTYYLAGITDEHDPTPDDLEKAKQNIAEHIDIVGLTERFDESLILLKNKFGWSMPYYKNRNVGGNRPRVISDDVYALAHELNHLDAALYAFAEERFEQEIKHQGLAFHRDLWRLKLFNGLWQRKLSREQE